MSRAFGACLLAFLAAVQAAPSPSTLTVQEPGTVQRDYSGNYTHPDVAIPHIWFYFNGRSQEEGRVPLKILHDPANSGATRWVGIQPSHGLEGVDRTEDWFALSCGKDLWDKWQKLQAQWLDHPIEIHVGEFCRKDPEDGENFDNLWIRYQGQFRNTPTDCLVDNYVLPAAFGGKPQEARCWVYGTHNLTK